MSTLKRIISTKLYEMERNKVRRQAKRGESFVMPKIITFAVGNDKQKKQTSNMYNRGTTRRRQKNNGIDTKKLIGLALIVIGCVLVLGKCFGGNKEPDSKPQEEMQTTQSFGSYVQDFNIKEDDLNKWLNYSQKHKLSYAHTLGVWAYESYSGASRHQINKIIKTQKDKVPQENQAYYESAAAIYEQFIYDIEVFPIEKQHDYTYENTWKQLRTYKSERPHLGTDLMSANNKSGEIPILSITSGTVEQVGWNELGGYRVGIRSEGGAYFYYAHLHENPDSLKVGDHVLAGQVIGIMGNTGYGEEGTAGKFPVHLHLGIAVSTEDDKEYWINPYGVLMYLEKYKG